MKKFLIAAGLAMAVMVPIGAGSVSTASAQGYERPNNYREAPPPRYRGDNPYRANQLRRERERERHYDRRDRRHREVYRDRDRPRRPGFSIQVN